MKSKGVIPGYGTPTAYAVPSLVQARALHAFAKGEATQEQQLIVKDWLFRDACRAGREVLVPGQPDATAYLAGRLSVFQQIGWVLSQQVEIFRARGEVDN